MRRVDLAALRRLHIAVDCLLVSVGWLAAYGLRWSLSDVLGPINEFESYGPIDARQRVDITR